MGLSPTAVLQAVSLASLIGLRFVRSSTQPTLKSLLWAGVLADTPLQGNKPIQLTRRRVQACEMKEGFLKEVIFKVGLESDWDMSTIMSG